MKNNKGGFTAVFVIILIIAAVLTIGAIILFKPEPKIVVSEEVVAFSKLKGCDTENGQVWCSINSKCIDLKKEVCEKTTVTDSFGCDPNTQKWCMDKCISKTATCTPTPINPVINNTPPPIVFVNTTMANTTPVINTTTVKPQNISNNTNNVSVPTNISLNQSNVSG